MYVEHVCNVCALQYRVHMYVLWLQLVCFTGMVRVGVKIPQDGNHANR